MVASVHCRKGERRTFFHRFAHGRAEFGMQNRGGMFEFAVFADCRGLAVAFDGPARNSESGDSACGE